MSAPREASTVEQRAGGIRPEQGGDAGGAGLRRQIEGEPAVEFEPEGNRGRGERQPAQHDLGVIGFGARLLQEFPPRRRGVEQLGDHHAGAWRAGGGHRRRGGAALHPDGPGVRRARRAGGDGKPPRGADRRQCLAAEAERGDAHELVARGIVGRELRGGVALHGQGEVVGAHAAAVIDHLDALDAAAGERDRDARRPGVERVLDQLLDRRRRTLDHLAGGDAVDQRLRQQADRRPGGGEKERIGRHRRTIACGGEAHVGAGGKGFDPLELVESNATTYPEAFRAANQQRWNRRLGDHAGLSNFGVNLTRIVRGGQSSCRHWHTRQDEFVYVLAGEVILQTDAGEQVLRPGMCAGFPAGERNGHRFLNRGAADVLLLVVGDRTADDEVGYPDIDMHAVAGPDGRYRYTRKDGTPLD